MLRPLNIDEQLRLTPFVQDHTLTVLCGTSRYGAVLRRGEDGRCREDRWDIPQAKKDCDDLREILQRYQTGGEGDVYALDSDPTVSLYN